MNSLLVPCKCLWNMLLHTGQQDVMDGSNGQSSGYHSSAEDGTALQQQLSAVEVENQLLRNEVASLNQEMQSMIRRIQSSNEGTYLLLILYHKPGLQDKTLVSNRICE